MKHRLLLRRRPRSSENFVPGFLRLPAGWYPASATPSRECGGRAFVIFTAVGLLVYTGASMKGNVFTSNGSDAFDILGYVADIGTGCFYFLARLVEKTGADVSHAQGDYGTRFPRHGGRAQYSCGATRL